MRVGNWRNKSKLKFDNPLPKLVFFKEKPQFNDSIFYLFSIYLVFQRNKPVRINPGTPCTPVEPVSPITPDWPAITQSPFYITIKRAQITAAKEPSGLLRSDSKHPDGATLWPWAKVKLMAWDVTVPIVTIALFAIECYRRLTLKSTNRSNHFLWGKNWPERGWPT